MADASPTPTASPDVRPAPTPPARRRRLVLFALCGAAVLAAGGYWGVPAAARALATVSTDDAYVNGHVTLVAPRVAGQVGRVLVDDNYRVAAGDLLVQLDPEPYRVLADVRRAGVTAAEAELTAARAATRGLEAAARGQRWRVQNAVEQVNNQAAGLRALVAAYRSRLATRDRAQADYRRVEALRRTGSVSPEELDQRLEALRVAEAAVAEALEQVHRARVSLGLPADPGPGGDLTAVPPDLAQTFSSVRQALGELAQALAQLGLPLAGTNSTPDQLLAEFRRLDPSGDVDRILERLVPNAPAVKQAEAKLLQARRDLDQAELNLRYCDVRAEIDGVVSRRNVNPGNNVAVGQQLMAVRSLTEVWVDANFKETQLADLAIGQRAEVTADVYGTRRVFRGRVTGFTPGTGSTLALLPAQNATGNFVKVVQRLPVRIEFEDYDPDRDALFAGLSVVPTVFVREPPAGPNAGRKIQQVMRAAGPDRGEAAGPATRPGAAPPPGPTARSPLPEAGR